MLKNNVFKSILKMELEESLTTESKLNSKFDILSKVIWIIVKFAVCLAASYLLLKFILGFGTFGFTNKIPYFVITFIYCVYLLFDLLSNQSKIKKNLFYDKKNNVLFSYPISKAKLYLSKLVSFYFSIEINFLTIMIPILYGYFFVNGASVVSFIISIISSLFLSLFSLTLSLIISLITYFIEKLLSKVKVFKDILVILASLLIYYLLFKLVLSIPQNVLFVDQLANITNKIESFIISLNNVPIISSLTPLLIGDIVSGVEGIYNFNLLLKALILLTSCGVILVLLYILFNYKYTNMYFIITVNKTYSKSYNKKTNKIISSIETNLLFDLDSVEELILRLIPYFILPIVSILLNRIFATLDLNEVGKSLSICSYLLIQCLIILTSNSNVSNSLSKQGYSLDYLKTLPISKLLFIILKILPFVILSIISISVSSILAFNQYVYISEFSFLSISNLVWLIISSILLALGHLLFSIQLDLEHSEKLYYYNGSVPLKDNNIATSLIVAILLSILYFVINLLFLLLLNPLHSLVNVMIFSGFIFILNVFVFTMKYKLLF